MKTFSKIILSAGIFLMFAGGTVAQKAATLTPVTDIQKDQISVTPTSGKFVDNNKNGVCDNWEAKSATAKNNTGTCNKGSVNCPKYQGSAKCQAKSDCCEQVCKGNRNCSKENCQPNPNCCKKDQKKTDPDKK